MPPFFLVFFVIDLSYVVLVCYNGLRLCLNIQRSLLGREINYLLPERRSSRLEIPDVKRLTPFDVISHFFIPSELLRGASSAGYAVRRARGRGANRNRCA